ncbi:MAG: hypothetical protein KGI51_08200 [Rhodospirillales bacterium]|nr:hypothetical protein [Rhodospirillales bacterium]
MESRVAVLEELARASHAAFERIDRRFDTLAAEMASMRTQWHSDLSTLRAGQQTGIDSLRGEYRSDFRWLLGSMFAGFAAVLGALGGLLGVILHTPH